MRGAQAARPRHDRELARHVRHHLPRRNLSRGRRRDHARRRHVRMAPLDRRVRNRLAAGVPHDRGEGLHVAGAHRSPVRAPHDLQRGAGELAHRAVQRPGHALEGGLDPHRPRRQPLHMPEFVHLGAGRVARPPDELRVGPARPVRVQRGRAVGDRAALEEGPVRLHLDAHHRGPLDHHRNGELEGATAGSGPDRRDDDLPLADFQRGDGGFGAAGGLGGGRGTRERQSPPGARDPHRFVHQPALAVEHLHDEGGGFAALEHQAGRVGIEPRGGLGGEGGGEGGQGGDRERCAKGGSGRMGGARGGGGRGSRLGLHGGWSFLGARVREVQYGDAGWGWASGETSCNDIS